MNSFEFTPRTEQLLSPEYAKKRGALVMEAMKAAQRKAEEDRLKAEEEKLKAREEKRREAEEKQRQEQERIEAKKAEKAAKHQHALERRAAGISKGEEERKRQEELEKKTAEYFGENKAEKKIAELSTRDKFKRTIAVALVAVTALAFAGCGSSTKGEAKSSDGGINAEEPQTGTDEQSNAGAAEGGGEKEVSGTTTVLGMFDAVKGAMEGTIDIVKDGLNKDKSPNFEGPIFDFNQKEKMSNGEELSRLEFQGQYDETEDPYYRHSQDPDFDPASGYFGAGAETDSTYDAAEGLQARLAQQPDLMTAIRVAIGKEKTVDSGDDLNKRADEICELGDGYADFVNETIGDIFKYMEENNAHFEIRESGFGMSADEYPGQGGTQDESYRKPEIGGRFRGDMHKIMVMVDENGRNVLDKDGRLRNIIYEDACRALGYDPGYTVGDPGFDLTTGFNIVWRAGVRFSTPSGTETNDETPPPGEEKPSGEKGEPVTGGGEQPAPIIPNVTPFYPPIPEPVQKKDPENLGRIDDDAATGMAGAYDGTPVGHAPVAPVKEQPVTGKPSGGDYEGTDATFVRNKPSKGAETVGVQPAPVPIPENPVGPGQPDYTPPAPMVDEPSAPGTELDSILGDIGISN